MGKLTTSSTSVTFILIATYIIYFTFYSKAEGKPKTYEQKLKDGVELCESGKRVIKKTKNLFIKIKSINALNTSKTFKRRNKAASGTLSQMRDDLIEQVREAQGCYIAGLILLSDVANDETGRLIFAIHAKDYAWFCINNNLETGFENYSANEMFEESMEIIRVTSQKGNGLAQVSLARSYEEGIGIKKNKYLAYYWYLAAQRNGIKFPRRFLRTFEKKNHIKKRSKTIFATEKRKVVCINSDSISLRTSTGRVYLEENNRYNLELKKLGPFKPSQKKDYLNLVADYTSDMIIIWKVKMIDIITALSVAYGYDVAIDCKNGRSYLMYSNFGQKDSLYDCSQCIESVDNVLVKVLEANYDFADNEKIRNITDDSLLKIRNLLSTPNESVIPVDTKLSETVSLE